MAVKSVIDIEINDAAFKRYADAYGKYEAMLKNQPKAWAEVIKKTDGLKNTFDGIVSGMVAANVNARLMVEAQAKADQMTKLTESRWKNMVTTTKSVATNVAHVTTSLVKWSTLSTAFMGLVGAGSLYGIERLGSDVVSKGTSARGLGVSYGERASFASNTGQFAPSDFLSRIAGMRYDPSQAWGMSSVGLSGEGNSSKSNFDLAMKSLISLKKTADEEKAKGGHYAFSMPVLSGAMNAQEMAVIANTPMAEIIKSLEDSAKNVAAADISVKGQEGWRGFMKQMTNAGNQIESIFGEELGRLTPQIESLSKWVVEATRSFAGWIDGFLNGAKARPGAAITKGLPGITGSANVEYQSVDAWWNLGGIVKERIGPDKPTTLGSDKTAISKSSGSSWWTADRVQYAIDYLKKNADLPDVGARALVARWAGVESTAGGPNSVDPRSGARGIASWLGKRQSGFIMGDVDSQLAHAVLELKTMEKQAYETLKNAKNDMQGAVGASQFERAEGWNGTQDNYVQKTINTARGFSRYDGTAPSQNVKVDVWSNADVNVSAALVAYGSGPRGPGGS